MLAPETYALTTAGVAVVAVADVQPMRFRAIDTPIEAPSPMTPAASVAAVVWTSAVIVDVSDAAIVTPPKLRTTLESMCAVVEVRMRFVAVAPAPARLTLTPKLRLAAAAAACVVELIVALEVAL